MAKAKTDIGLIGGSIVSAFATAVFVYSRVSELLALVTVMFLALLVGRAILALVRWATHRARTTRN